MPLPPFRSDGWLPEGHHSTTWEEVATRFGGTPGSTREKLTKKLLSLRDGLRACECQGRVLLDGSYVSHKSAPGDFDVMLILQPEIQAMKENDSRLSRLLDAEMSENQDGVSIFYAPENSLVISQLLPLWDFAKDGTPKGIVEVKI